MSCDCHLTPQQKVQILLVRTEGEGRDLTGTLFLSPAGWTPMSRRALSAGRTECSESTAWTVWTEPTSFRPPSAERSSSLQLVNLTQNEVLACRTLGTLESNVSCVKECLSAC